MTTKEDIIQLPLRNKLGDIKFYALISNYENYKISEKKYRWMRSTKKS